MNPDQNETKRDEDTIQDVSGDEAEKVAGGDGTIQPPPQDGKITDI